MLSTLPRMAFRFWRRREEAEISLLRGAGWDAGRVGDAADLEETATPGRTLLVTVRPVRV